MTKEKAYKIFEGWQNYIETGDKLMKVFTQIPESFLPYPVEILEEALNIVAKECFDNGDKDTANTIQHSIAYHLGGFYLNESNSFKKITDEEALQSMKKKLDIILENKDLKEAVLKVMEDTQNSWLNSKK